MKVKIIKLTTPENTKMDVNEYISKNGIEPFKQELANAKGVTKIMLDNISLDTPKESLREELEEVMQYLSTLDELDAVNQFRNVVAKQVNLPARETDDYVRYLRKLQKEKTKKVKEQEKLKQEFKEKEEPEKEEEITEEDKKAVLELLNNRLLMYEVLQIIQSLGVAGEAKNILLHYCTLTSRILDDILSEVVKGDSSAGKSYVILKVLQLFPRSAYIDITDATAQSSFYVAKDYFAHKIIVIFEKHGQEKADYSIRTLQSEKKLKIQMTVKDTKTGQFMTKEKEVNGPTGFITTTTEARIHAENETRNISVFPDESIEQTLRTFEISDRKYRGVGIINPDDLRKWIMLQRLLKPYPVLIPFVEEIRKAFPPKPQRVRRDYPKFLALITTITILHQEQREKVMVNTVEHLKATLADYHIAKMIMEDSLVRTLYELTPKTELIIKIAEEVIDDEREVKKFTAKEIATRLEWDSDTVNKWLKPAIQKGYINELEEHKGSKPATYTLTDKKPEHIKILPATEELIEKNPEWLGNAVLYDPIEGEEIVMEDDTTDVPMPLEDGENTHDEETEI